jgi:hypothetical protein
MRPHDAVHLDQQILQAAALILHLREQQPGVKEVIGTMWIICNTFF